jgi:CheY-like chemotaxis protein
VKPVRTVSVLVVDDDRVDTMALQRSFRKLNMTNPMIEAHDGIEALDRLRGTNGYQKVSWPCVVLLDLNLPRMGGIEFLDELRRDPLLRRILVFVMTTSAAKEDRIRAYDRNIAGYLLKHSGGEAFLESIRALNDYWRIIEFPD